MSSRCESSHTESKTESRIDIYANSKSNTSVDGVFSHDGPPDFKACRATSCNYRRGYKVRPMSYVNDEELMNKQQRNIYVPLFKLLIDGHHFDVLVLLHFIPRGGIGLGPNDYTAWRFGKRIEDVMMCSE